MATSKRKPANGRMTGRQWREKVEAGVWITLPSGLDVRVGSVGPDVILRTGQVPDSLTPLLADMINGRPVEPPVPKTQAELLEQMDFMNAVATSALLEPRIVDDPQAEDEIALRHLDIGDRAFLVGLLGATLKQLETFRDEQARGLEVVAAESDDAAPAE